MSKSSPGAGAVVALAMAVMVHFADIAVSQVSRNKINQFPRAAPSPPSSPPWLLKLPCHCPRFIQNWDWFEGCDYGSIPFLGWIWSVVPLLCSSPPGSCRPCSPTPPDRTLLPLHSNLRSWCALRQQGGSPPGIRPTVLPPLEIPVQDCCSTSGDDFKWIFRSPVCSCFDGSTDLPSTNALRSQSTQVYTSLTPLRPSASGFVATNAMDSAVFPLQIKGYIVKLSPFVNLYVIWLLW